MSELAGVESIGQAVNAAELTAAQEQTSTVGGALLEAMRSGWDSLRGNLPRVAAATALAGTTLLGPEASAQSVTENAKSTEVAQVLHVARKGCYTSGPHKGESRAFVLKVEFKGFKGKRTTTQDVLYDYKHPYKGKITTRPFTPPTNDWITKLVYKDYTHLYDKTAPIHAGKVDGSANYFTKDNTNGAVANFVLRACK